MSFETLLNHEALAQALAKMNITEPTDIQAQVIPHMLEGRDVIGQAHTGSGKTLAYLCPILMQIDPTAKQVQALILAPTHELVMQIYRLAVQLCKDAELDIRCMSIIGEANINNQITKLKEKPQLIVGTPGRVLDLIKKKKINCQTIRTVIIDEMDNLLDNTNQETMQNIIKSMLRDRQLAAFSATASAHTLELLKNHMHDPVEIVSKAEVKMNPNIEHFYLIGEQRDKFVLLRKLLHALDEEAERILIFMNDGPELDFLVDKLNYHKIRTYSLHGIVDKEERQKAMDEFRRGKIKILVSSDLAARGLDIPDITHVINMDFPAEPNEYIHRSGRTARGERTGQCYSLVNPKELAALRIYQRDFEIEVKPVHLVKGKILSGATKEYYKDPNRKKKSADKKPTDKKKTSAKKDSGKKPAAKPADKKSAPKKTDTKKTGTKNEK
ncbi:MAG: DEAD/DEAH box helicase [Peptococcaceae bacterium]|nr:DEAD/DEAH box helicase [Peptococcaceae bacterium]MBO5114766.1 DEAD/DEAH box helicase [Peptococcaceae bacterium]MBO5301186.1 DEAD/DEAH box helicase [Peptococcaceae bacterium]MBO5366183.1 DEAD/DEAH box helicase [Peptococcaceae bacterium]